MYLVEKKNYIKIAYIWNLIYLKLRKNIKAAKDLYLLKNNINTCQ